MEDRPSNGGTGYVDGARTMATSDHHTHDRDERLPSISVCMATLNAATVVEECLRRLRSQDYPPHLIELIVADGGSTDATVAIVERHGGRVLPNPLKTGEAGKAEAVRAASNDLILLLDSDNWLPGADWLRRMVKPFADPRIGLAEPIEYTWRPEAGFIERYCALIGMNDPLCLFLGNYDRWCTLTGKWTEVPHDEEDRGTYLQIRLTPSGIPTVGANGALFRREFLQRANRGDHLFDVDVIADAVATSGEAWIAKVKVGIIHTYCEGDWRKFYRKQRRRIQDYLFHKQANSRKFDWESAGIRSGSRFGLVRFIASTVLVVPLLVQTIRGLLRKPDTAWLFHVPACWITLVTYAWGVIEGRFVRKEANRSEWRQ